MPGFRKPGRKGRMAVGFAAFARHLGLHSHSGTLIPRIDCAPFKTSKSGVLFTTDRPCLRRPYNGSSWPGRRDFPQATGPADPLPFPFCPNIPAGGSAPSARTDA